MKFLPPYSPRAFDTADVERAWCAETSTAADWSPDDPAKGQCAVTALVVQDHLGGVLLRTVNEDESHYWNRLPDGTELDLTRAQFGAWDPGGITERDREYVLSFPDTKRRYELLLERMAMA